MQKKVMKLLSGLRDAIHSQRKAGGQNKGSGSSIYIPLNFLTKETGYYKSKTHIL